MVVSRICKTPGLVIRNLRFGDTSRVATLFTHELGKTSVIGKGVRVPKSPFGASLELFAYGEYVLYFRSGRNLQMLKSGDVEYPFDALVRNSARYRYGCAVLEFLDRMLLEEEAQPGLFELSLRVLGKIESLGVDRLPEVFRAFQLRTASLLGYRPRLDSCLQCESSLEEALYLDPEGGATQVWLFRPSEGGAFCPRCAGVAEGYPLTIRALKRLQVMAIGTGKNGRSPRVLEAAERYVPSSAEGPSPSAEVSRTWIRSLEGLVEDFLRYHVERYRGLRSLASPGVGSGRRT